MNTDLTALILGHKWVPLAALVIGICVRLLKSDTKIPLDIPPRLRIWLAFGLGAVSGVLEAVVVGTPWPAALIGGLVSTTMAVMGQNVVIDSLRGGKEFVVPGLTLVGVPPSPGKPVSIPPGEMPKPPTLPLSMLTFLLLLSGCGLFLKALDLAADKAKCVVDNQDLQNKEIFVKCAIEDPEKYLELLGQSRAATRKALERQAAVRAPDCSSTRVDGGGAPDSSSTRVDEGGLREGGAK